MLNLRTAASDLFDRLRLGRMLGIQYGGRRDLYQAFGYDEVITLQQYRDMYERGGIAGAAIDALPKATWRGGVDLVEDPDPKHDTEFELAWKLLATRLDLIPTLEAADILSGLSQYAVLVIGAGGTLDTELPMSTNGQVDVTYFKQYLGAGGPSYTERGQQRAIGVDSVAKVTIKELDKDTSSPNYGWPKLYQIKGLGANGEALDVHASRVIHIAEATLEDPLYAAPGLQRIWNLLQNLEKVTGGGSEAYFQRVHGGRVWSIDKDINDLKPAEAEAFAQQIEDLQHNVVRDVRARGLTVQDLGSNVSQFGPNADSLLTQIAGAKRIPKRILTGSEMGELASSQDRDNWRDQVSGRRQQYAFPRLLKRLVDRLIKYQYLPTPAQYEPKWGAVMNLTEDERGNKLTKMASAKSDQGQVFTNEEMRWDCYEKEPLTDEQKQQIADALDAKAERAAANAPKPAAFPRAASSGDEDDELITVLHAAIEAGDMEVIDAILLRASAFDPDQPRDDDGQWTAASATKESTKAHIDKMLGGAKVRRRLTIDKLASFSKDKLQKLHVAYSVARTLADNNNDRMSYAATMQAIQSFLK